MKNLVFIILIFLFAFKLTNGDVLRFKNNLNNKYLDLISNVADGVEVITKLPEDSHNQKWVVNLDRALNVNAGSDFLSYSQNGKTLKVMTEDIYYNRITTNADFGKLNQRWILKCNCIGYQIINRESKKCLSVHGDQTTAKTNTCDNNDKSQLWTFENFNSEPPEIIDESWHGHSDKVKRVYQDQDVAIYYADNMPSSFNFLQHLIPDVWRYVKNLYGNFGPDGILYGVFHWKSMGGHPGYFFFNIHGFRNLIDVGANPILKPEWGRDIILHEISHIVESCYSGFVGSPSFDVWGDSQFAPIFMVDVLHGVGRSAEADIILKSFINNDDENLTRDWFHPIWRDYGGGEVLNKYFMLIVLHFPKNDRVYARRMNLGEFVHFWSGATGVNLKAINLTNAFRKKWNSQTDDQYENAKRDFSDINY